MTIWSIGRHIVTPMPTAGPLIAATIGLDARTELHPVEAARHPADARRPCRCPGSLPSMRDWNVASMSAPAQNPRPAPVVTMAPTAGSSLARVMASTCSSAIVGVQAFEPLGAVERDDGDLVADLVGDLVVLHGGMVADALPAVATRRCGRRTSTTPAINSARPTIRIIVELSGPVSGNGSMPAPTEIPTEPLPWFTPVSNSVPAGPKPLPPPPPWPSA